MSVLNMKQKKQRYDAGLMLRRFPRLIVMIRRGEGIEYSMLSKGKARGITPENAVLHILNFGANPPLMHNDERFTAANGAA